MLPLYFIDHEKSITPGLLDKHGFAPVIDSPRSRQILRDGPGGQPGLLVGQNGSGDFRHVAGEQTWVPRFGFPGTYVGIWNAGPPTPAELKKADALPGVDVTLLDGHRWNIPLLRQWLERDERIVYDCKLPTVLQRNQTTGLMETGAVIHPLRSLWERSCQIADQLLESSQIAVEDLDGFVGDLFAINYRATLDEISLLGLLDIDRYREVVFAALDWSRLGAIAGNLQRRLAAAGTSPASNNTNTDSGVTPPIGDDSGPTDQP